MKRKDEMIDMYSLVMEYIFNGETITNFDLFSDRHIAMKELRNLVNSSLYIRDMWKREDGTTNPHWINKDDEYCIWKEDDANNNSLHIWIEKRYINNK